MTDTEQPSQWAVELAHTLSRDCNCGPCVKHDALTIQRAFAEREAELVEILKVIKAEGDRNHNTRCRDWWPQVTAALKSREAGHAQ